MAGWALRLEQWVRFMIPNNSKQPYGSVERIVVWESPPDANACSGYGNSCRSIEVSLIPIKWGHYAETQEARREAEESAATRTSEGLEANLGLFGRARVGSQTMGGGRNAPTSRGPIRLHFFQ
jgi:hypothetical protein